MATKLRKTRALIGRSVIWHGYDGQDYRGIVSAVRHGWVTIEYPVNFGGIERLVTTRTDTTARFSLEG